MSSTMLSGKAECFMKDKDHSAYMLQTGEKDFTALKSMQDVESFADEIFGFHAQQSVEKFLKAWISYLGDEYPLIHDLSVLLSKLESLGCEVNDQWDFVELNAFAVQFRYESFDSCDEPLDRQEVIKKIQRLFDKVNSLINR